MCWHACELSFAPATRFLYTCCCSAILLAIAAGKTEGIKAFQLLPGDRKKSMCSCTGFVPNRERVAEPLVQGPAGTALRQVPSSLHGGPKLSTVPGKAQLDAQTPLLRAVQKAVDVKCVAITLEAAARCIGGMSSRQALEELQETEHAKPRNGPKELALGCVGKAFKASTPGPAFDDYQRSGCYRLHPAERRNRHLGIGCVHAPSLHAPWLHDLTWTQVKLLTALQVRMGSCTPVVYHAAWV